MTQQALKHQLLLHFTFSPSNENALMSSQQLLTGYASARRGAQQGLGKIEISPPQPLCALKSLLYSVCYVLKRAIQHCYCQFTQFLCLTVPPVYLHGEIPFNPTISCVCPHLSTAKEMSRNPKISTTIHLRSLKSNNPSSLR